MLFIQKTNKLDRRNFNLFIYDQILITDCQKFEIINHYLQVFNAKENYTVTNKARRHPKRKIKKQQKKIFSQK